MFVCVVADTGFGSATGFVACVTGLGVLTEAFVFLTALIATAPAAETLTLMFVALMLGKSFDVTGLDWVAAVEEQLWSAGNRCEGQN